MELIKDGYGVVHEEEEVIAHVVASFFSSLFSTSFPCDASKVCEVVTGQVTKEMRGFLGAILKRQKVYNDLMQMKPTSALGPVFLLFFTKSFGRLLVMISLVWCSRF